MTESHAAARIIIDCSCCCGVSPYPKESTGKASLAKEGLLILNSSWIGRMVQMTVSEYAPIATKLLLFQA
jgi:hypothetical protein